MTGPNKKRIFELFEEASQESQLKGTLDDNLKNLIVVISGVPSYQAVDMSLNSSSKLESIRFDSNFQKQYRETKQTYFDEFYSRLVSIPLEDISSTLERSIYPDPLVFCGILDSLLAHFLSFEEYEKCSEISKYILKVKQ